MAVTAKWYGNGPKNIALKKVDWNIDIIKVALCSSLYIPDQDNHEFFSAVTNELATAGGYTAGGVTLTGKSVTYDAPTNETRLIAGSVSINPATFTARYGIIYQSTGTAVTSILLGYIDFGTDFSPNNGPFTITWDVTGALKLTAA